MRWIGAQLRTLLPAAPVSSRRLSDGPISLAVELRLVEEIRSIMDTFPDAMERHLYPLAPLLTPHVVSAVLLDSTTVSPSFRFFVWSSRRKRLRSWTSHNRIIYILRGGAAPALETLRQFSPAPPAAFEVLISAHAADGRTDMAVECFQRMSDFGCRPRTFTYNTLMRILISEGVALLAQSLYSLMLKSDCRPNRSTFSLLIDALCKDGKTDDALALFDEMSQRQIPPNNLIFTVVLSGLCRARRLPDAQNLLSSMTASGLSPDTATFNALLHGFCQMGRTQDAISLFSSNVFSPTLNSYSILLNGLFKFRQLDLARHFYSQLLNSSLTPDCVLYTIMIKGMAESGRLREAFSFLGEMTNRGVLPDTFCYNTLIKALCDAGHLNRARSLLLHISNSSSFPNAATYTILICGLCDKGLLHEAQSLFDEMGRRGCAPTVVTFNALIRGLCRHHRHEEARHLLYKMEMGSNQHLFLRLSQGPTLSGGLRQQIDLLCDSGRVVDAYRLLRGLADAGAVPDVITYNTLIQGFCETKDMVAAAALFKEMKLKGYAPDSVTYGALARGYVAVGQDEMAAEVVRHMVRSGVEPVVPVYRIVAREFCNSGKVTQAAALWSLYAAGEAATGSVAEMVRSLLQVGAGKMPYGIWMAGLCRVDQNEEAYAVFTALCEGGIAVRTPTCALLIQRFCRAGKMEWALRVMDYSLEKGLLFGRPVGNRVLRFLWQRDKRKALKLAGRMAHAGYALEAYLRKPMKLDLQTYCLLPEVGR